LIEQRGRIVFRLRKAREEEGEISRKKYPIFLDRKDKSITLYAPKVKVL